jgi:hypothetical protein
VVVRGKNIPTWPNTYWVNPEQSKPVDGEEPP